ncbi:MAG: putative lipid II flippase FtsW [Epsilonproteobacteria bacterium]|nr:putative lipid II flippase FtsW [Campylobacterota bacterium]|tara:strand:+ start:7540 stop:8637 length:1098 start_codon:yes stop_codon:yes gene_type:complete
MFEEQRLRYDLCILLLITATFMTFGVIFVYSSSSFYAFEKMQQPFFYVKKQLFGIMIGALGFWLTKKIPLQIFKQTTFFILLIATILTAITMTPLGFKVHGSQRWLNLAGFLFQPSELLKIAIVLHMSSFLSRKKLTDKNLTTLIPILGLIGCISIILLKQPDFGCMVTICTTTMIMLFIANLPIRYFVGAVASSVPLIFILIYTQPYRWQRIVTYLNPWQDPQGSGFQIIQALIAEGSGGVWGNGIAQSKQKFLYLPMQHTDFIFAIIAEEIGFIGSSLLIILCILFVWFGFRISWKLKDQFSVFLVQGITTMISLQFIINLFVATGLAPTKGIGLPFISYGNTALVCNMLMIGLIVNAVQDNY